MLSSTLGDSLGMFDELQLVDDLALRSARSVRFESAQSRSLRVGDRARSSSASRQRKWLRSPASAIRFACAIDVLP
jgi:hypothetical protein